MPVAGREGGRRTLKRLAPRTQVGRERVLTFAALARLCLITALALVCVAVAGVVVGRVVWDRGHTYTTADVQAALLAFRAPGPIGTLDPPQPGSGTRSNGSPTNAAGCDVLVRQPTGFLDGGTWSPSEDEPASKQVH